jgi:hypothetical protein
LGGFTACAKNPHTVIRIILFSVIVIIWGELPLNGKGENIQMFYKTGNGARVGDLYMSLIHTCESNGANPFHYLTELQKHAAGLAQNPKAWRPWNYRETLQQTGTSQHPSQAPL